MDTDRSYEKLVQDETLIKRRPWYVLAAALFVLSALTHQPIAFLAALFALVIGLVPELWYRYALRHLVVRQSLDQRRAFFGEPLTLSISVENQKLLPLPWLEIEDEIPAQVTLLTGHASPSYKVNRARRLYAWSCHSAQRRPLRLACPRATGPGARDAAGLSAAGPYHGLWLTAAPPLWRAGLAPAPAGRSTALCRGARLPDHRRSAPHPLEGVCPRGRTAQQDLRIEHAVPPAALSGCRDLPGAVDGH